MCTIRNKAFCLELEASSSKDLANSERELVEETLGQGAVKYQLSSAGFLKLFRDLADDEQPVDQGR